MPLAYTSSSSVSDSETIEFDSSTQNLAALESAAYRLIGIATCQIQRNSDRFICRLTPKGNHSQREPVSGSALRERFLDLVTDENLRLRIAEKTESVRNVILALAFGSLASSQKDQV
jgi:His-Xaa-Ser system protein HxsD